MESRRIIISEALQAGLQKVPSVRFTIDNPNKAEFLPLNDVNVKVWIQDSLATILLK